MIELVKGASTPGSVVTGEEEELKSDSDMITA